MSSRAVDLVVRRLATEAKLELSAHILRHTFVINLIRSGADVVLVAEIAGHRRLDTTRRYSLPSELLPGRPGRRRCHARRGSIASGLMS